MSIASEFESTIENVQNAYQGLANLGATIPQNKTIENISDCLDEVYDVLPKTSFQEGTDVTIEGGLKGKIDFDDGKVGFGQASQVILPSEYQQVDYIESTGTQYIDTGVLPNSNQKIEIKLAWLNLGNTIAIGSRTSGAYNTSTDQIYLNYNSELTGIPNKALFVEGPYLGDPRDIIGSEISLGVQQTYTFNANKYQLTQTNQNYYIFCLNNIGTPTGISAIRLYSCKIYDNETLVRDFIPCYRISNNEIGLYDIVNNVFYTNQGTGTFTKGANAPTPNAEIPIQCVTGNQSIVVSDGNNNSITYPISLGNNKFYNIGDYADELLYDVDEDRVYKNEKIKEYVLSDLFWAYNSSPSTPVPRTTIRTIGITESVDNFLSNIFDKDAEQPNTIKKYDNVTTYISMADSITGITSGDTDTQKLQKMLAILTNKNANLLVIKDTSTEIEITDTTLVNQVKALYNAHSLNGTTIITSNGNLPMIIKVRALKGES